MIVSKALTRALTLYNPKVKPRLPRMPASLYKIAPFKLSKARIKDLSFSISLKMSTTAAPPRTSAAPSEGHFVEHVVLFKVKPSTPPSTISTWLASLNALSASVPSVLHLVATPILRTNSPFTHLLHARYPNPAALAGYSSHPDHLAVVHRAGPMCEDIMALDWVSRDPGSMESPVILPRKAVKVTFLKLKEGLSEEEGVADVIAGIKEKVEVRGLEALTVGENFSPGRAKGFRIGSVAVFAGREEMMEAIDNEERLKRLVEEVITVDFVAPEK